jgi:benzoate membrane transport protein
MPSSETAQTRPSRPWLLHVSLAIVALSFSATGPVAIITAAAQESGLSFEQTSSWLFSVMAINALGSLLISWKTRQPLMFLWTIPGTVLVAPIIQAYGFNAAVGTYITCSAVLLILGISNLVSFLDRYIPMPLVMAMVAGLFVKYVLDIVHATVAAPWVGSVMLIVFFAMTWLEQRGKAPLPPILATMICGAATVMLSGFELQSSPPQTWLATPKLIAPEFNLQALLELLVPMLITVLFVQNAQGIAVLRNAGHATSLRLVTIYSGFLTALTAPFGGCPSVLAGPCNAIFVSAGRQGQHYIGTLIAASICIVIGIFATAYVYLLTILPGHFIVIVAGLAMLGVLEKSFVAAFTSPIPLSALAVFIVTQSGLTLAGIGSPFWGLIAGCALCRLCTFLRT